MIVPGPLFLRAPPFPWVDRAVAAVSVAGRTEIGAGEADRLIDALRAARVGGAFWTGSGPGGDPWTVLAGSPTLRCDPDDELASIAWLVGVAVCRASGKPVSDVALRDRTIERLRAASYRDPFTGAPATPMATIALLGEWRAALDANRAIGAAVGIARWKRTHVRRFLWDGAASPAFLGEGRAIARAASGARAVAAWPSRVSAQLPDAARTAGVAVVRLEDGFIRSRGLGSDLHPPWSIVADTAGIYYDPAAPSDLERLLATHPFPPALLARAARLRESIVAGGVSKYGDDAQPPAAESLPRDRRVVLAVGQVEDDLSVRLGGVGLDNAGFLQRVRDDEPDAFVVYRPHPDVLAGHRRGEVPIALASRLADRVDAGGALLPTIERADAVHVLSSLTGFEALLRGRPVTVHGQPFYAGWGLTRDLAPQGARRGRHLSLDALVAATLILYPRYLDPATQLPCPPEVLIARFAEPGVARRSFLIRTRRLQGRLRRWLTRAKTGR